MKDTINKKFERGDVFRLLAPRVRREDGYACFEQDINSPYIMQW